MKLTYQWCLQLSIALLLNTIAVTFGLNAEAQIIPDTSPAGTTNSQINGGLISGGITRGVNLFHSFREFNVGGVAIYFDSPNGIDNIFARVIDKASRIDGTLGVQGNANLFLINPNGISFGPNAKLELGGSFLASTANSILFPGGSFSASTPVAPPILDIQVKAPIGLQFEGKPRSIILNEVGGLQSAEPNFSVPPGNHLALIGGDIEIFGKGGDSGIITLQSSNASILLGSIAEAGTLKIANGDLEIPNGLKRGKISFKNGALIEAGNQGATRIYANDVDLIEASKISGDLNINAIQDIKVDGASKVNARNIKIDAASFKVMGGSEMIGDYSINTSREVLIEGGSKFSSGNININADFLKITGGSGITGDLSVKASREVLIEEGSKLNSENININAGSLKIISGADIIGNLSIKTSEKVQIEGISQLRANKKFTLDANSLSIIDIKEGSVLLGNAQINVVDDINLIRSKIDGDNITFISGSLILDQVSTIATRKLDSGNVGSIVLQARGKILLSDESKLFTGVPQNEIGNAGKITVVAESLKVQGGSQINSAQSKSGNGGNISLQVSEDIFLVGGSGIFAGITEGAMGSGGNIHIQSGSLNVLEASQLNTSLAGNGKAGNIDLQVRDNVSFAGESNIFSGVSEKITGTGGDIHIRSGSLNVLEASQLNTSLAGNGKSGNIDLVIRGITLLDGTRREPTPVRHTSLLASIGSNGTGNTGNINIKTGSLRISDGAEIVNGNSGKDNDDQPGSIKIVADNRVDLLNGGGIRAGIAGSGNATSSGDINIEAKSLFIDDGAQIELKIGGIAQKANNNIFVKAGDSVTIAGRKTQLETGIITDVQGGGSGNASGITVQTPKLILRDNGRITASTASGNGGNVTLENIRFLFLRNGSLISATAGQQQAGGNGGNIRIDADPNRGFVIAVPSENSDITANAFSGAGGKVEINARSIFGLVSRSRTQLEKLLDTNNATELNPAKLSTSDVTAISQENPSLNGQVALNASINPNQGVTQVPKEPRTTDTTDSCQVSNGKESVQFFDIGRGGLPPRPEDSLSVDLLEWASNPLSKSIAADKASQTPPDRSSISFQASNTPLKLRPPCQSN